MCNKVVAAVGELEEEYGERVDFVVVPAEETARRRDEIVAFGFEELKHGLVAFDPAGVPQVTLPGHQFGKEEIRAAVETVLEE
jgi:hypothetical protein